MRLLIHIPSRGRPKQLADCVARFRDAIHNHEETQILISIDSDDQGTPIDGIWATGLTHIVRGLSANKIAAINRDLDVIPWDILVCASDDLSTATVGFDNAIRRDFEGEAPDLDAVLWYEDENPRIVCHPVIGRAYYERDGYVFHPSYQGFYCDDEFTIVAQRRDRLYRSSSVRWLHAHPNYRTRKPDQTDARAKATMMLDYRNFAKRQSQGFPKTVT